MSLTFPKSDTQAVAFGAVAMLLLPAMALIPSEILIGSLGDYLPLHSFLEMFAVVVCALVALIGWSPIHNERAAHMVVLSCGFLAVGLIDFAHLLSFAGMPDFVTPSGVEKAIDFWLAARVAGAVTLLIVAIASVGWRADRALRVGALGLAMGYTAFVYVAVLGFQDMLPATFVPGTGLTQLKIGAEYSVMGLQLLAALIVWRSAEDRVVFRRPLLLAALLVLTASEMAFTLYSAPHDLFNLTGHVYKVIGFYLIYRMVFVDAVRLPYLRQLTTGRRIAELNRSLEERMVELRREREHALEASKAKSEFLANMSHELRTPLNAILGYSEIMHLQMFGELPARYHEYSEDIFRAAGHLRAVIDDILDMSRIEAGKHKLALEQGDLATIVRDCVRLVEGRAQDKRLKLEATIAPDVPVTMIDSRAVAQVLLNLLSNAIKFTPPDGHIRVDAFLDGERWIAVSVRDTGIGIAPENLEHAFEPFWQAEHAYSRQHEGAGLGLSISKKLIELHGGRIGIESQPGQGTTVTFRLPLSHAIKAA
jgi:two-component system sensor histidine kinase BarA